MCCAGAWHQQPGLLGQPRRFRIVKRRLRFKTTGAAAAAAAQGARCVSVRCNAMLLCNVGKRSHSWHLLTSDNSAMTASSRILASYQPIVEPHGRCARGGTCRQRDVTALHIVQGSGTHAARDHDTMCE